MAKESIDYRELSSELDTIITRLEDTELPIDEAMSLYEHGAEIIKKLEVYLASAETKVTNIKAKWEAKLPKE